MRGNFIPYSMKNGAEAKLLAYRDLDSQSFLKYLGRGSPIDGLG